MPPSTPAPCTLMVYVHDIDRQDAHLIIEGADVTIPVEDTFDAARRYEATDLEGHRWHVAERFADLEARGGTAPVDPARSRS